MLVQTDVNIFLLLTSVFKSNQVIADVVPIKLRLIPPFGKRMPNARILCVSLNINELKAFSCRKLRCNLKLMRVVEMRTNECTREPEQFSQST